MPQHHVSRANFRVCLVDPIGHGSSGTVWRAWDRRDRRYVAAKAAGPADPVDRMPLDHPHVLQAHDRVACDHGGLMLMRLVRGGTADRLLADHGALPAAYVAVLLDQLLGALEALHAAGVAHRDVKPANLLLEPTGTGRPHLWLGDLGVASRLTVPARTFAGTDGYLAPDVEPGSPPAPGHDLYAAGVSAAELLTGRLPRGRRDLPRGSWRGLLGDLTATDPARRPASAAEARARLRAIGVPGAAPWQGAPHAPDVPDRMRRLTLRERWQVQGVRAAQ